MVYFGIILSYYLGVICAIAALSTEEVEWIGLTATEGKNPPSVCHEYGNILYLKVRVCSRWFVELGIAFIPR